MGQCRTGMKSAIFCGPHAKLPQAYWLDCDVTLPLLQLGFGRAVRFASG